ncbi:MAG: EAL domain-containing protein [Gammaproteobacteria bacterium]|nr:EAL domain-containing protein [Gammaproteobacteria bacterium]
MNDRQPAKVLFLIDKQSHCDRFVSLLGDLGFEFKWERVEDVETLKKLHEEEIFDLILYWHQRKLVDEIELVKYLAGAEQELALILMADTLEPRDYIQAGKMHAADVINTGLPAQFAYVLRRELTSVHVRRKLSKAICDLTEDRIFDESEIDTHVELNDMSDVIDTIDDAIRNNKFDLIFQPIIAVQNDGYDNFEVFMRIRHKGDFLRPEMFMPVAKAYGLMPSIDRWVIPNAIKRYKAEIEVRKIRKNTKRKLRFFLNISGHTLADESVMAQLITEIAKARLEPDSLVLEVGKHAIQTRLPQVKALNQSIMKLKQKFAIDHYEENDNSLNYLKHISADFLKIDNSVLDNLNLDFDKQQAVRGILEKAKENNISVIASQVDKPDILPTLYGFGVQYVQGYIIGEPGTRLEYQALDDTTLTGSFERVVI